MLGSQVRYLRLAAGLSQEQLAELAGVHRTFIGTVERGESNITLQSVAKLARGLKVPIIRLFEKFPTEI